MLHLTTNNASPTLAHLPQNSGVYQYFDKNGHLLYVGKAKNLKKRIKSYFTPSAKLSPRIASMVSQVSEIKNGTEQQSSCCPVPFCMFPLYRQKFIDCSRCLLHTGLCNGLWEGRDIDSIWIVLCLKADPVSGFVATAAFPNQTGRDVIAAV